MLYQKYLSCNTGLFYQSNNLFFSFPKSIWEIKLPPKDVIFFSLTITFSHSRGFRKINIYCLLKNTLHSSSILEKQNSSPNLSNQIFSNGSAILVDVSHRTVWCFTTYPNKACLVFPSLYSCRCLLYGHNQTSCSRRNIVHPFYSHISAQSKFLI